MKPGDILYRCNAYLRGEIADNERILEELRCSQGGCS